MAATSHRHGRARPGHPRAGARTIVSSRRHGRARPGHPRAGARTIVSSHRHGRARPGHPHRQGATEILRQGAAGIPGSSPGMTVGAPAAPIRPCPPASSARALAAAFGPPFRLIARVLPPPPGMPPLNPARL